MKICVYGLWHLGCVIAACLASKDFHVIGFDNDPELIAKLSIGNAPIYEPGLDELIKKGIASGKLSFTNDVRIALKGIHFLWLAFDTPVDDNDHADVDFVLRKLQSVLPHFPLGSGVIISSQVPAGFTGRIEKNYKKRFPKRRIVFAYSPENLRLGEALRVFLQPDRIIIGIRQPSDKAVFSPLFSRLSDKLEWMKTESAEMTKHAINSFLATSIVFANSLAEICRKVGANPKEVERGMKTEGRIGPRAYLSAGGAYSGGTLARDIDFLIFMEKKQGIRGDFFESVRRSNQYHQGWTKRQCLKIFPTLRGASLAILGLTYKPGTDTLRRSFAIQVARWLSARGAKLRAYDPHVHDLPSPLQKIISLKEDLSEAVRGTDGVIFGTQHPEFRNLKQTAGTLLRNKRIIDPYRTYVGKGSDYFAE